MNEKIENCLYQSGLTAQGCWDDLDDYAKESIEKFGNLIIDEVVKALEEMPRYYKTEHDRQVERDTISDCIRTVQELFKKSETEPRTHIGYCEREEGYYKVYAPKKGQIVTQAFILCKYCNAVVSGTMGPRSDVLCISCYEKDPTSR